MLEAKSLRKTTVPPSLLPFPSPGSIQPTRLALRESSDDDLESSCCAYFASGRHVYSAQVSSSCMIKRCPHRYEIQSIALVETSSRESYVLGSVDSHGHLIVSEVDADDKDVQNLKFSISPQDCGVGEGSWAGLSFNPSQWWMVAVARSFPKCIDVYDQEVPLKKSKDSPFYLTERSILAVTEGCQLTLWDLRMKENGGCLQRVYGSPGDILYATSTSSTGNITVAGADRTVTIYDPRRWSVMSRWTHCSKYQVTGLAFSSVDPDYIYVQGVDYEVFCGEWRKGSKIISFRGDSKWLGFNKCPNTDVLGGWCDSGSIFVAHIAAKTGFERLVDSALHGSVS